MNADWRCPLSLMPLAQRDKCRGVWGWNPHEKKVRAARVGALVQGAGSFNSTMITSVSVSPMFSPM